MTGVDYRSSVVLRWSALCDTFSKATRIEVAFWDMALRGHV